MFGHVKKWPMLIIMLIVLSSIGGETTNKTMKNVLSLSSADLKLFLESFDTIISDCDGVLWTTQPITGVKEVIAKLKTMGKKIHFVSNNNDKSKEETASNFNEIGIDLDPNDLIFPALVMTDYLKSQNFTKKSYIMGTPGFIKKFEEAGLPYVTEPNFYTTDVNKFISNVTRDEPEIGAVVLDMNANLNYYTLTKAIYLLRNPEIMYLVGSEDYAYIRVGDFVLPGFGYFSNITSQVSGRTPKVFGKPSEYLKNMVFKRFNITDPQRTLFIGDMLIQDMGFASMCGFQKLFVLSGGNSLKDAINTINPSQIPDYWIDSLGHLQNILG